MVGSRDSVSWGNDVGPTGLINSVILDRYSKLVIRENKTKAPKLN